MASAVILRAARARIADPLHWTQGTSARDEQGTTVHGSSPTAVCWCAVGALRAEGCGMHSPELRALKVAASTLFGEGSAAAVNDRLGHAAVLKMYDAAIALVWGEA